MKDVVSILLVFLLTFLGLTLYSQDFYKEGFIVKSEGDTLRGRIEKKEWYNSPILIKFQTEDGIIEEFGPEDIVSFAVEGQTFISAATEIEVSSRKIASLEGNSKLNLRPLYAFLKEEVSGPFSLYSFRNDDGDHFFLQHSGELEALYYKYYKVVKDDGSDYVAENNRYKMQLDYLLSGECNISFDRVRYKSNDLRRALEKYYSCVGYEFEKVKKEGGGVIFSVFGGATNSFVNHGISPAGTGNSNSSLAAENFRKAKHSSLNPTFGLSLEFPLRERSTSLRTGLSFVRFSSDAVAETSSSFRRVLSSMEYENRMTRIFFSAVFRPLKNRNIEFGAGPTISRNYGNKLTEIRESEELLNGNIVTETYLDYISFVSSSEGIYRTWAFGLQASVSYKLKPFLVSLKVNRSEDIVDLINISLNQTEYSLTIQKTLWSTVSN